MAEGNQTPATEGTAPVDIRALSLIERLALIRADSFGIGKDNIKMSYFDKKSNERKEFTIKGHTVEAVLSEMRPLLSEMRVMLLPNLIERTYSGNRCDVLIAFEWESLDRPDDRRVLKWAGAGCDDGDKGFSKAGTNALKEHLKKLFLITDRDDAKEEEEKVEHKTDEGMSRAASDKSAELLREANEKRAKLVRGALLKADTLDDVNRLVREHNAWLKQLPDVTATFFADLIKARKAAFAEPATPEDPDPEEVRRREIAESGEEVWEDK